MGRSLTVTRRSTKIDFLQHLIASTKLVGEDSHVVMTSDAYAREHVRMICESLQLGLTRLYRDREGYGYELRITRAGRLLAAGEIEAAAALLDSGAAFSRLAGDPPEGALGALLNPSSKGMSLHGMAARQYAPEMMRGVATGHLVVADGVIHAADNAPPLSPVAGWTLAAERGRATARREAVPRLPSSRAARHVTLREP